MNYNKKSIEDIEVAGKRVLCRCDFNVPTKEGRITSDKRIVAAMPTIQYLVDKGAKVILCSHMGKPKGEWKPELSLKVVAERISQLLGKEVIMATDVAGEDSKAKAAALKDGDVMLIENTRYIKGETKNDPELSKALLIWLTFSSTTHSALLTVPTPPPLAWLTTFPLFPATWFRRKFPSWARLWPIPSVPSSPFWAVPRSPTS